MDSSVRRTAGSQVQFEHLHLYLDMGASDSNAISVAVPMVSSIRCRHSEKISSESVTNLMKPVENGDLFDNNLRIAKIS